MTPNTNIAATYQGTKVNTASPAELTLMLYEGAIKFCNKGIYAIEDKNINKANENLLRAQKISSWSTITYTAGWLRRISRRTRTLWRMR